MKFVVVPALVLLAALGAPVLIYWLLAIVFRDRVVGWRDQDTCQARLAPSGKRCGYSLQGLGTLGICPECGTVFVRRRTRGPASAWRWRRLRPTTVVMLITLAFAVIPASPALWGTLLGLGDASVRRAASAYLNAWPNIGVLVLGVVSAWLLAAFVTRTPVRFWSMVLATNAGGLVGAVVMLYDAGLMQISYEWVGRALGMLVGWVGAGIVESVLQAEATREET